MLPCGNRTLTVTTTMAKDRDNDNDNDNNGNNDDNDRDRDGDRGMTIATKQHVTGITRSLLLLYVNEHSSQNAYQHESITVSANP